MTFSASTCLTYTGTTTLIGPISIFTLSGQFITAVTLNQITNCPLVLTGIPDFTTTITLKSANNFCCDVALTCNNLCTTCNLAFNSYSTSLISRIIAGDLTGSCQSNITDYRINWYKTPNLTTPVFTSGYGSSFTPYNYTHPLTGTRSPMQPSGTYIPMIDKIKLNGLNYSQTVQPGFIQANLKCFNSSTINVLPFNCSNGNGTSDLANYTHRVQFSGASAGVVPLVMTSTFQISAATTNYFAWQFKGELIPDTLTITYYGSHYNFNPIILEKWVVGNNLTSSNNNLLTLPKSGKTSGYLSKVTSLTSLTRNTGDYIILEVTPNPNNTQTNWDFYFTCKNTFDCNLCAYEYLNKPYKIKASSIRGITGDCATIRVDFDISGCTENSMNNIDIFEYSAGGMQGISNTTKQSISTNNTTGLLNRYTSEYLDWDKTQCDYSFYKYTPLYLCSDTNTNTITFKKRNIGVSGQGFVEFSFSNLSDFSAYYSSYQGILQYSGTPSNPSLPDYYRYYELHIPIRYDTELCGDGTLQGIYQFHYSSVLTTGFTSGNYTITITMPTITNGLPPYDPCDVNCNFYSNYIIDIINSSSTGSTNIITSMTSNTGSRYIDPFGDVRGFRKNLPTSFTASTMVGYLIINDWNNTTIPFSGNTSPFTPIPSLSAITCNNYLSAGTTYSDGARLMYMYYYQIRLTDPMNVKSYQIVASPITNGVPSGVYSDLVATVVNGSLTYANTAYTF